MRRSTASAELLGERDDDALGAADVTEPILVLVLRQLANEFGAMGAQAGKDVLDAFDGEHGATYAQRVRGCVFRLSADRRGTVELHQLKPAVAVLGPHHGDFDADAVKPHDAVRPTSLGLPSQVPGRMASPSVGWVAAAENYWITSSRSMNST